MKLRADVHEFLGAEVTLSNIVQKSSVIGSLAFTAEDAAVDCSGITRIDTSGIQLLVAIGRSAAAAGGSVAFTSRSEALQQALDRAGVTL